VKFGPKMENGPRPARVELSPRAWPRSGPKPKTAHDPLFLRPYSVCQVAMRPEMETGPPARSRSARPALQAATWAWARKVSSPTGLNLGPVIMSRPSQSDGCARFPTEQNNVLRRRANPSLISLLFRSLSRAAASDSERPTSGTGESEPEAPP
jgi:hypothetical protein